MAERTPLVLSPGGELEQLPSGDTILTNTPSFVTRGSGDFNLSNADFAGGRVNKCNGATDKIITIPAGLINIFPATIFMNSTATVTIAADVGVTLRSADSLVILRVKYSVCQIIPLGSETYLLFGDLV